MVGKDLEDVYFILRHYFEIAGNALYDQPYDDLLTDDFEPNIAAARMLGQQMAEVLREVRRYMYTNRATSSRPFGSLRRFKLSPR